MKRKTVNQRDERMIDDLVSSQIDLQELAQRHGMTLRELAQWAAMPEVRRRLAALCMLADFRTQLILSRHRVTAAAALLEMTHAQNADQDLKRKACVDLMRANLPRTEMNEPMEAATEDVTAEMARLMRRDDETGED